MSRRAAALLLLAGLLAGCASSIADGSPASARPLLVVGTSGDYAPFSRWPKEASEPEGLDAELARAYAADRGMDVVWVRFRWPELSADLAGGRFEVAMSGVTIRPDRSVLGRFTVPVVQGGALPLVRDATRFPDAAALDAPGIRIAVNQGGHLERVANAHFPRARILPQSENAAVPVTLSEGRADAALTDVFEAPYWLREAPGATALAPITRDIKAFWVRADRPELASDLDDWLLKREADGSLGRLRARRLGSAHGPPVATALDALLAAIQERLSLMPLVAAVKRQRGLPIRVPEREAFVLDRAVAELRHAARRAKRPEPSEAATRSFFEAQIAAAREIQQAVRSAPAPERSLPSLEHELRPALLRIGERIARLVVAIPDDLDPASVRARSISALRSSSLSRTRARAIADSLAGLAASR